MSLSGECFCSLTERPDAQTLRASVTEDGRLVPTAGFTVNVRDLLKRMTLVARCAPPRSMPQHD